MPISSIPLAATLLMVLAVATGRATSNGEVIESMLRLDVAKLTTPGIRIDGLSLLLDRESLRLATPRAQADVIGLDGPIDWECRLSLDADGRRHCAGPLRGVVGDGVELAAVVDVGSVVVTMQRGDARLRVDLPLAAAGAVRANLHKAPLEAFNAPLQRHLSAARLHAGEVDAEIVADLGHAIEVQFSTRSLGATLADGVGVEAVDATGSLRWDERGEAPRLTIDAGMGAGVFETPQVRIELPGEPVRWTLDATSHPQGRWVIARLQWLEAGVLALSASGEIDNAQASPLQRLHIELADADLLPLRQRYLAKTLQQAGLMDVDANGRVAGTIDVDAGAVSRVDLRSDHLRVADRGRDMAINGLAGRFIWQPVGQSPAMALRWTSARIGGVAAGPFAARLRSNGGAVELARPVTFRIAGGEVDLRSLHFDPLATGDTDQLRADADVRGIGWDSADGRAAVAGLHASARFAVADVTGLPRLRATATLNGGELLYGAFYAKLPANPVDVAVDLQATGPSQWTIGQLDVSDPGVVDFQSSARVDLAADHWLPSLQLRLGEMVLAEAAERYGKSWLMTNGHGDLLLAGKLAGEIEFDGDGLQRFAFRADRIGIDDGAGRFAVSSLSGAIDWQHGSPRPATTLGWSALHFYRIPFGPATAELASRDNAIVLEKPVQIGVLGGRLIVEKVKLDPRSPRGERYNTAVAIAGIDMAQLSDVLGWPRFPGSLSGGVPDITLAGDSIEFGGGLVLWVFDGRIDISRVTLERPFGIAPALGAGIYLRNLDLKQITSAFEIAAVSGRLDGDIRGLRMVDWSPVSFDAWLRTQGGGRMSYKVVQDVTSIGGGMGSITTSLQNLAMKVVDTFGYRRFGIRCKLVDTVCTMGGIDPTATGDSYTIVEGAGVPRISIVGHRRRVDWPTFVDRVIEAMTGNGPVVE